MKHKHAELIKAWADGAQIQYRAVPGQGEWCDEPRHLIWEEFAEYRIKPEPVRVFREVPLNGGYILRFYPSDTGWMCGISNEMMDAIEEVYR